jgi:Tfp pilus assembly protein PilW
MSARLVTLLMIGLLILGLAGQSWAQLTRTYSNPMNFSSNQANDQNFQMPHFSPDAMNATNNQNINKKFNNLWGGGNSGTGVEVHIAPTFSTPWGSTPFGPSRPDH